MTLIKVIDQYFPSLDKDDFAYIRNSFTANAQMLQAGTVTQEKLVELQHDSFARDVYSKINLCEFLVYDV